MTITFLRVRPAERLAEPTATSRRREGTTAVEMLAPTSAELTAAHKAGVLVLVGERHRRRSLPRWVVKPEEALSLAGRGVPGWRLTVVAEGSRESILDALARSGASFARSTRSEISEMTALSSLPGVDFSVSVFVDDVSQALRAVDQGATDLLLRDWDVEGIGELRAALGERRLVERTAFPPGIEIDEARSVLSAEAFTAWLSQVDGSGVARPRYEWAPGKDLSPPVPDGRLSAEWLDGSWLDGTSTSFPGSAAELAPILERSLDRHRADDGGGGGAVPGPGGPGRRRRTRRRHPQRAGGRRHGHLCREPEHQLHQSLLLQVWVLRLFQGPAQSQSPRRAVSDGRSKKSWRRSVEAWGRGATEVTLQGGIHPDFTGNFYVDVVNAIKAELPDMHIHGFTPLEVWQGAETLGIPVRRFLEELKARGSGHPSGDRCRDPRRRRQNTPVPGQDPDLPVGRGDDHRP